MVGSFPIVPHTTIEGIAACHGLVVAHAKVGSATN